MKIRFRICTDQDPDHEGEWLEKDLPEEDLDLIGSFQKAEMYLKGSTPGGYHLIEYEVIND